MRIENAVWRRHDLLLSVGLRQRVGEEGERCAWRVKKSHVSDVGRRQWESRERGLEGTAEGGQQCGSRMPMLQEAHGGGAGGGGRRHRKEWCQSEGGFQKINLLTSAGGGQGGGVGRN